MFSERGQRSDEVEEHPRRDDNLDNDNDNDNEDSAKRVLQWSRLADW